MEKHEMDFPERNLGIFSRENWIKMRKQSRTRNIKKTEMKEWKERLRKRRDEEISTPSLTRSERDISIWTLGSQSEAPCVEAGAITHVKRKFRRLVIVTNKIFHSQQKRYAIFSSEIWQRLLFQIALVEETYIRIGYWLY